MSWTTKIGRAGVALLLATGTARAAEMLDLQVADVLARPGDSVELVAKLEKKSPRGANVPGVAIEFRLDGKSIGRATTDERGMARLKTTAPERGDHRVKAVYDGTKDVQRAEFNALLAVRKADEPIVAVDIDHTLAHTDDLNTAAGGADCPPLAGAPEAMAEVGRKHTVVYVTGRARQLRKRTIGWIHRYDFPAGPSYYLDPRDFPTFDVIAFRTGILKELAGKFSGLRVGIGDSSEDVEACAAAGLKSIVVGKNAVGELKPIAWSDVPKAVADAPTRKP